jgi:hypothetical protein
VFDYRQACSLQRGTLTQSWSYPVGAGPCLRMYNVVSANLATFALPRFYMLATTAEFYLWISLY